MLNATETAVCNLNFIAAPNVVYSLGLILAYGSKMYTKHDHRKHLLSTIFDPKNQRISKILK